MIKRVVLCVLFIMSTTGCSRIVTQEPLFIDSNVSAGVYSGDKRIGTTPFFATLRPEWTKNLSLRKKGYKTQPVEIKKKVISYLSFADDKKTRESDYDTMPKISEIEEPIKLVCMAMTWIIFSPIIVPALLISEHPATYAQSMYYVEMKPEK